MGIYLEDAKLDSVLEDYFEEENKLIYESCMKEYLTEMYQVEAIYEAKTEEEKKEKLEARIAKAKESIKNQIQNKINSSSKKYSSFKLDCHEATTKERAQYLGLLGLSSATGGIVGGAIGGAAGIGMGAAQLAKKGTKKAVIKQAAKGAVKGVAKTTAKYTGIATAIVVAGSLLIELIKQKRYKDIYTIKLYGVKDDGSEKLIGWWTSVKIQKSDLDSEYKSKVK